MSAQRRPRIPGAITHKSEALFERASTGRHGIVKMEGIFHGDGDAVQRMAVPVGGGVGLTDAAGVSDGALRDTWALPYNDAEALRAFFKRHPLDVAAVIVEPVAC